MSGDVLKRSCRSLAVVVVLVVTASACGGATGTGRASETASGNGIIGPLTWLGSTPTGSRPTVSAPTATATAAATTTAAASVYPNGETGYRTPEGLRFVDETGYEASLSGAKTLPAEETVLQRLGNEYGLTIDIETGTPSSYAQQYATWQYLAGGDAQVLKGYAALFIDEWAKYPKAWIRVSGVTTVVFVKDLVVSGAARYAMPDPVGKALYLDVGAADISPTDDYDYARGVMHHEFDHDIESELFGGYSHDDPAWIAFNPSGFTYGSGGASWYDGKQHVNTPHPQNGFVDAYAMTAIEEDKAETYAYIFVTGRSKILAVWVATDPQLAGKVAAYKALIKSKVPMMDDSYFAAINP